MFYQCRVRNVLMNEQVKTQNASLSMLYKIRPTKLLAHNVDMKGVFKIAAIKIHFVHWMTEN